MQEDGRPLLHDDLGVPVEPELHTPHPMGAVTSGMGVVGYDRLSSTMPTCSASTTRSGWRTANSRLSSQAGRSHRTGTTVAPTFQPAKQARRCSGELRQAHRQSVPHPEPPVVEEMGQLGGPGFELGPGEGPLAAVLVDEDDGGAVTAVCGHLAEPCP